MGHTKLFSEAPLPRPLKPTYITYAPLGNLLTMRWMRPHFPLLSDLSRYLELRFVLLRVTYRTITVLRIDEKHQVQLYSYLRMPTEHCDV